MLRILMRKDRFVSSFQVIKHLNRLVAMAEGFHAFPYRTRPLSLPAPMVLGPKGPGRVGRRQANNHKDRYRVIDNGLLLHPYEYLNGIM